MGRQFDKALTLLCLGGLIYGAVEVLWRGYTHPTMMLFGGLMFVLIGGINNYLSWEMPLALQCLIGAFLVTTAELLSGCILNIWLGLGIWDYSQMPFNILGQICLPFSIGWYFLSAVAIVLDDSFRCLFWGEEHPRYTLWHWKTNEMR